MSTEDIQANQEPNPEQDSSQSENSDTVTISKEDVNKIVNSAISSRFKSFEKKLDGMMSQMSQPQSSSQTEETDSEDVKFNKKEFSKLRKELDKLRQEKEQEVQKSRASKLDSTLQETLLELGVSPQMLRPAKALLKQDGVITYSDTDDIVFQISEYEQKDLKEGLASWIKSDEGKHFLPASNAKGSGDKSYRTKHEHKKDPKEVLTNFFFNE